jgi:hypothetical protein
LKIWRSGDLEPWKFGNLEIWKFGNLVELSGICPPSPKS